MSRWDPTERLWRTIEDEFGLLSTTEVKHLLESEISDKTTLKVERDQSVVYPGFQFDHMKGRVLPVVADLRELGEEFGYNEATIIQWLCGPTTYLDDGDGARRPVDLLKFDPKRVLTVARSSWGVVW